MDTGNGRFAELRKEVADQVIDAAGGNKEAVPIFEGGETLTIRGSKFQIRSLDAFTGIVTLKLLPRDGSEKLNSSVYRPANDVERL
jgi:hypothetical protein